MKEPSFLHFAIIFLFCILLGLAGLFLLANFGRLLRGVIRREVIRKNVAAWLIIFCFVLAVSPIMGEFFMIVRRHGWLTAIGAQLLVVTLDTLIVFNSARLVSINKRVKRLSFVTQKVLVVITIVVTTLLINIVLNYMFKDYTGENMKYSAWYSIYFSTATGMVYIMVSYLDLERKRKFDEKELELSRLRELKTKAELDALHSKVNPHFLYNALNSIADLSITDGKKARKMTIALADLFRYSINYSNNNYTTVQEETEMSEVYLQIEKIRFEDKLNYTITVDPEMSHYLVPRFVLQPLVENAVKHGLKATGELTFIKLDVKKWKEGMLISVVDNGPPFEEELNPGYGLKSVFDKLDMLFPGDYEIRFSNSPGKEVSLYLKKLMKNEPGI
jgi:sensor histidine kinase YesM